MASDGSGDESNFMGEVPEFLGGPSYREPSHQLRAASMAGDNIPPNVHRSKDNTGGKSSGGSGDPTSVSSALLAIAQQLKALTDWKDSCQMSAPVRDTQPQS